MKLENKQTLEHRKGLELAVKHAAKRVKYCKSEYEARKRAKAEWERLSDKTKSLREALRLEELREAELYKSWRSINATEEEWARAEVLLCKHERLLSEFRFAQ